MIAAIVTAIHAAPANAGGLEIPDNGTQAVGRGGAFVAKADDPTAIYYNPAGLARQRGTKALVDLNVFIHSFDFVRLGNYPAGNAPYAGDTFPPVTEIGGPSYVPFVAFTSDFEAFDRLTVGAGIYGPSMITNRTFPVGLGEVPAPSRYDSVQQRHRILMPTASVGYRLTKWLDLGLSAHLGIGTFDETNVWYKDNSEEACPTAELQICDVRNDIAATGSSFSATIGAMARASPRLAFGLSIRTPASYSAGGMLTPQIDGGNKQGAGGAVGVFTTMPLLVRAGARHVTMDGDFELYDLEVDATYEGWTGAQGAGQTYGVTKLDNVSNAQVILRRAWRNTFSLRVGGAYNIEAFDGVLTFRGGAFYDSPATAFEATRIETDTLAKLAGTFGLGYRTGPWSIDVGYAAIASLQRKVGTGDGNIRPINPAAKEGIQDNNSKGGVMPAINEGIYKGFTQLLSLGVTVTIDSFLGGPREIHYRNDYEPAVLRPKASTGPGEGNGGKPLDSEPIGTGQKVKDPDEQTPEKPEKPEKPESKPEKPTKPEGPDAPETPETPGIDPPKPPKPEKKPEPPPPPPKKWWEDEDDD